MKPFAFAIVFCTFSSMVFAAEEKSAPEAVEETLKVERVDVDVLVEVEGTLDVARHQKLKVVPEEFPGPYGVVEILPSGQRVKAGAVVVRLDTGTLDRVIRGGQEALDAAKLKVQTTGGELEHLKSANRLKGERMAQELKQSERDLKSFDKYGEEQLLGGKELAVKHQAQGQANREQELEQLEKMYKDAKLASETKEIVLERTRREVALGREGLALAKKAEGQIKEFDHPAQKEKLSRAIEQKKQDLDAFNTAARLDELKKDEELKAAERALRDAQERMERLQRDLTQMTVTAPFSGVFRHGGIETGDKVGPNAAFADLLDTSHFEVRFQLTLRELQVAREGDSIKVRVPDLAGLELDGKILEIAWTASAEGQDKGVPRYLVRAKVDDHEQLRHGARVSVEIRGEKLKDAIALPGNAVFYEGGRAHCKVRTDKGVAKRQITVGLGDRERVAVLRGLTEGETVILKEGKK